MWIRSFGPTRIKRAWYKAATNAMSWLNGQYEWQDQFLEKVVSENGNKIS